MENFSYPVNNDLFSGQYQIEQGPVYDTESATPRKGRLIRLFVGVVSIIFGIIAFTTDVSIGYYPLKIGVLACILPLLFQKVNYPFLLGLMIPIYFEFKPSQFGTQDTSYMVEFAFIIITLMAARVFLSRSTTRSDTIKGYSVEMLLLIGILLFALFGAFIIVNKYLYVRRIIQIVGYISAFYLGRTCLQYHSTIKLLLTGLSLGIIGFILPWPLYFVAQNGIGVLGTLGRYRGELGAVSVAIESGIVIVAFGFAFSISVTQISQKTKNFALWFVVVPSTMVVLLYLSRAAIVLLPASVALTLFFAGRRRAAIGTLLISLVLFLIGLQFFSTIGTSIMARMQEIGTAASIRKNIYDIGLRLGFDNFLLGVGAGQFRFHAEGWFHSHNDEITIFAEHGFLSSLFYLIFMLIIFIKTLQLRFSHIPIARNFAGSFLVVMACYFIYAQIEPMYFNRGGMLFTFLAGILSRLYSENQQMAINAYQNI
jgi:O-antigen ligase